MALSLGGSPEITLKITADATNAKKALADVESGIRKVESSAKATQDPISKVTQNITGLAQGQTKLSDSSYKSADALHKEVMALINADAAAITAAKSQTGLTTTTAALTAATGLSTVALGALTLGIGAVVAGATVMAGVLGTSTRHYFEHAEATRDSRDALKDLAKGWEAFQMTIGRSVLGDDFSIAKPIWVLNQALQVTGALIAARISEVKFFAGMLAQLPGFGGIAGAAGSLFSNDGLPYVIDGIATRGNPVPVDQTDIDILVGGPARFIAAQRAARRSGGGRSGGRTPTAPQWSSPGVSSGVPGWDPWVNPFGAGIPIPGMGWSAPGVTSGWSGPLPGTSVGIGGFTPPAAGMGFFGNAFGGAGNFGSGLANTILGSITGGGSALQGAGSFIGGGLGTSLAKMLTTGAGAIGGVAGGALNAFLPGIGSLLGPALGWLGGKMFGPTEYEMRQQQLGTDRTAANGILNQPGLERQWNSVGGNVPFGFDFLKSQAFHDPTAIKGYLDELNEKTARLNSAMEKYGISWEELGDQAKQSHIDQMAEDLILDFDVLTQAGADTVFVIEKMGDSINEFVQSAIRTGSEVPAAMRPMLETMVDMGLLTDASGAKIENLEDSGITFSKTMTQGFDAIVEAINRVAIGLGVTIPDAIDEIPRTVPIDVHYTTSGDYPESPDSGNYHGDGGGEQQYHNGGYVWPRFHRGGEVPAILQSGEFVMSRSAVGRIGAGNLAAMNRGGSGGGGVVVNFNHPVMATSHTQMTQFANMVSDAVESSLRLRARRYTANV